MVHGPRVCVCVYMCMGGGGREEEEKERVILVCFSNSHKGFVVTATALKLNLPH